MSIMFLERNDNAKRKSGARQGGFPKRLMPADFAVVAEKHNFRTIRLVEHFRAKEPVIRRWAEEAGVKLLSHRESFAMAKKVKREFDPALDNGLLRQAIGAMVGRASA